MGAVQYLFALALRPLIDGIGRSIEDPSARIDAIGNQLNAYLGEHRPQLTRALNHANERSWQALELALGGMVQNVRPFKTGEEQAAQNLSNDLHSRH